MGLQSVGRDLSVELNVHTYTDSSAAMGMVARKGMGRVRHVEVSELWIQDAVKSKMLTVNKVKGEDNPADILMILPPECGRGDSAPATAT